MRFIFRNVAVPFSCLCEDKETYSTGGITEWEFRNNANRSGYSFPHHILHKGRHDTQQQEINRITKMTRKVNLEAKEIQRLCKIPTKITTYVMRHTVSRIALENYGIYFLQNMHGHASIKTTISYAKKLPAREVAKIDLDL